MQVEQYLAKAENINEDFRLWITAEPHEAFPIGLLQMGIKITNEAPVGIKAGLRASFQWVTQDMLDAVRCSKPMRKLHMQSGQTILMTYIIVEVCNKSHVIWIIIKAPPNLLCQSTQARVTRTASWPDCVLLVATAPCVCHACNAS